MSVFSDRLPRFSHVHQESLVFDRPFEEIAGCFAKENGTVLLLSGTGLDCARYNILAVDPWLELRGARGRFRVRYKEEWSGIRNDPFAVIDNLIGRFSLPYSDTLLPVAAGLFGYFSYDLKDCIETLPQTCMNSGLPDVCLYAPSIIIVQDMAQQTGVLFIPVFDQKCLPVTEEAYIREKRERILSAVDRDIHEARAVSDTSAHYSTDPAGLCSSFTKAEYLNAVKRIIAYLKEGDIYQANLSQKFTARFKGDPFSLFSDLFRKNPAPFFSFINAGDHAVVSTSPERFLKVDDRMIETRPIKGTMARGATRTEDDTIAEALLSSVKDDAELTMIVDLMRNDLSRVTRHDTVSVREHKRLEPYDNVFHLVSVVTGERLPGKTLMDILKAAFPGGSITGCPKIRSMEIIDELEPVQRHVYTGSIGYVSFHDTMDLSIAIRTATIAEETVSFSVGGGIVYDSDPEKEFQETLDKGKTIMEALCGAAPEKSRTRDDAVWYNGKICRPSEAAVSLYAPGFQYGAGLFETVRVERGRIIRLPEHVNRLEMSWAQLFDEPLPQISWDRVVGLLIRENGLKAEIAAVKIMAFLDDRQGKVSLAALARKYVHRLAANRKQGLDLTTFPRTGTSFLADYKTMNYLYCWLAGRDAASRGADEALILNADQTVSETNTCSVLTVSDRRVCVPESEHALPGVTRAAVLDIMEQQGYEITTNAMAVGDLETAPLVIATNALMGAVPVLSIDGIPVGKKNRRQGAGFCAWINRQLFDGPPGEST